MANFVSFACYILCTYCFALIMCRLVSRDYRCG